MCNGRGTRPLEEDFTSYEKWRSVLVSNPGGRNGYILYGKVGGRYTFRVG